MTFRSNGTLGRKSGTAGGMRHPHLTQRDGAAGIIEISNEIINF